MSGTKYQTTAPISWEIGRLGSGLVYTVPVGTAFDVSVPRPLRWLFSPHNPSYLKAACVHDTMLIDGWTGVACGAAFHDALRADGVSVLQRLPMWLAVSLWKYGN